MFIVVILAVAAIAIAGKFSVWNHPNMPAKSKQARDNHVPYNL